MKIQEVMQVLFPQNYQAWMSLLQVTGQLPYFEDKDLPGPQMVDLLNTRLQDEATGWLRPKGKERWEITAKFMTPSESKIISKAIKQIGLYDEIAPEQKEYDAAFLMGATAWTVKARLDYAIKMHKEHGVTFKRLYVMAGWRAMAPELEGGIMNVLKEKNIRLNEIEMMQYIIEKQAAEPDFFKDTDIIYVNATSAEGAKRATTVDNFKCWKDEYMQKNADEKIIMFTNQPYVHYQSAVAFQVLSNNYHHSVEQSHGQETHGRIGGLIEIEAVGPQSSPKTFQDLALDSLGRFVYASKERWKKLPALQPAQNSVVSFSNNNAIESSRV